MDRYDVRVGESGSGLGFPGEAGPDVILEGELGRQHLDGDAPLESLVARPIDHTHATPTDLAFERVHVAQRSGESGGKRVVARIAGRVADQGHCNPGSGGWGAENLRWRLG